MPDPDNYNLDFRPAYYFGPLPSTIYHGATVKGAVRQRATIGEAYRIGSLVGDDFARPSLTEEDRRHYGALHPMAMGGEYLPDLFEGELEIARGVMWSSSLCDTISIRVRQEKGRYIVRVVDEYEDYPDMPGKAPFSPSHFDQPLSLREIIHVIDQCGMVSGPRQWLYDETGDAEAYANWVSVSSVFYPELAKWYEEEAEEWLAEHREDDEDEEEEEAVIYNMSDYRD